MSETKFSVPISLPSAHSQSAPVFPVSKKTTAWQPNYPTRTHLNGSYITQFHRFGMSQALPSSPLPLQLWVPQTRLEIVCNNNHSPHCIQLFVSILSVLSHFTAATILKEIHDFSTLQMRNLRHGKLRSHPWQMAEAEFELGWPDSGVYALDHWHCVPPLNPEKRISSPHTNPLRRALRLETDSDGEVKIFSLHSQYYCINFCSKHVFVCDLYNFKILKFWNMYFIPLH